MPPATAPRTPRAMGHESPTVGDPHGSKVVDTHGSRPGVAVSVCITGLFRTAAHVLPHLRRQYPSSIALDRFTLTMERFVVTNLHGPEGHHHTLVSKLVAPVALRDLSERNSSQALGLLVCHDLVVAREKTMQHKRKGFDWVIRQRIDTLGCMPSPAIAWPVQLKTILVPHGWCSSHDGTPSIADNWAFMSRDVFATYSLYSQCERSTYHGMRSINASIWVTGNHAPTMCFRIVRESNASSSTYRSWLRCDADGSWGWCVNIEAIPVALDALARSHPVTFNSSFETERCFETEHGATQTRVPCLWRPNAPSTCRGVVQPAIPILKST